MELEWKEPPPPVAGRRGGPLGSRKYGDLVDALKARPGAWALIGTVAKRGTGMAGSLRNKKNYPGVKIREAAAEGGGWDVYACWEAD